MNCELAIGAWDNQELSILTTKEEAITVLNKWCGDEEVPAENICALVRNNNQIQLVANCY